LGATLTQVLPFASEATLARLEANIGACPSVTDLLHQGASAADIAQRILAGLGATDSGFSLTPR
jgi:molecular chaperone Hsp33